MDHDGIKEDPFRKTVWNCDFPGVRTVGFSSTLEGWTGDRTIEIWVSSKLYLHTTVLSGRKRGTSGSKMNNMGRQNSLFRHTGDMIY
jgi:hypothetical protein